MKAVIQAPPGKFKAFALVRDKDGKPKIDDPKNCPPEILEMLTDEEKEELFNGAHPRNCGA